MATVHPHESVSFSLSRLAHHLRYYRREFQNLLMMAILGLLITACLLSTSLVANAFRSNQYTLRPQTLRQHSALSLSPLQQDVLVSGGALGASILWLKALTKLTEAKVIDSKLCRKVIHTSCAPLFICCWPLYTSGDQTTRLLAAAVPAIQVGVLLSASMKKKSGELTSSPSPSAIAKPSENADEYNVADAVSRSGDRSEAFGGPLIYTVVLLIATLAFFRDSPVGIIAISQMAVGDGLADIVGRRYGIRKWPFSDSKSIGGSLAFAIGAAISSSLLLMLLTSTGCMDVNMASAIPKLIFISILCAGVELVPGVDDNISVPAVGALAAWQLFE